VVHRGGRPVAGAPRFEIVIIALLYAFGAHGIMTLNDFKALEGDRQHGVRSLPVVLGPEVAAKIACTVMGMAQALVIPLLALWGKPLHALASLAVLVVQIGRCGCCSATPRARRRGTTARAWCFTSPA
jgi:chlorophyll/bacteriochlorophyll a synthase